MGYETWIAIGVVALVICLAAGSIVKAKKKGKKCIGCPGGCSSNCGGCGCGMDKQ